MAIVSRSRSLSIDYESEGFPLPSQNGSGSLSVTWDDLLWAAATVGRPNINHVFQHGSASVYELIFRWSMLHMALEQSGALARKYRRTDAFKALDPTEKGAVNYFLGMVINKLFANARLSVPWLLHLDVFRAVLNPQVISGRSRPDMVGEHLATGDWHAFESKGRASPPGSAEKKKAKDQALRLVVVSGKTCQLHVGAITYFKNDTLNFFWRDPPPEGGRPIEIPEVAGVWRYYYGPIIQYVRSFDRRVPGDENPSLVPPTELDLRVTIHPSIQQLLIDEEWDKARDVCRELQAEFKEGGYKPDGLLVKAGSTWSQARGAVVRG